jgi:hypothetical protein
MYPVHRNNKKACAKVCSFLPVTRLYKFRIGDSNWVHDGTANAEPDGFFGWNNKFEIPEVPIPAPAHDFDEDTELESVAAVESVADTVSEFGTEGDTHSLFHDEELIDRDEVIEDPDYAGMH